MTDAALMWGEDWIRCCICGELHVPPFDRLASDIDGTKWDVCLGQCAEEAGLP